MTWKIALIVAAVVGTLGLVYWLGYSHHKPPVIEQITTYIEADSIPAQISTYYITKPGSSAPPTPAEYARMDTSLVSDSGRTEVKMGIGYDEYRNQFDLRARIIETPPVPQPPRLFGLTTSLDIGYRNFDDAVPEVIGIGAGVKIVEKYSIEATINTDKTYGIRLGVDL